MGGRVVLLAGTAPACRIVYHALCEAFSDVQLIVERRPSQLRLIARRARKLGPVTVAGQVVFRSVVVPWLRRRSQVRIREIKCEFGLNDAEFGSCAHHVTSVNSEESRALLRQLDPDVIVVSGTRIVSGKTLRAVDAPFVNMHAGITPSYRGVHGGYWALCDGHPELVGTTVHFVDEGIDTGAIIEQVGFAVTSADSIVTYPYLHTAVGLPLLIAAIRQLLNGTPPAGRARTGVSKLRSHPTAWAYVWAYVRHGVK